MQNLGYLYAVVSQELNKSTECAVEFKSQLPRTPNLFVWNLYGYEDMFESCVDRAC